MPSAVIHRCVAKVVNIKLNNKFIGSNNFYYELGSIAPDCWRHSEKFSNSNLSKSERRKESHFMLNSNKENYLEFYNKYKSKLNNPYIYGYLIHLMTDNYWKNFSVEKYDANAKTDIFNKLIKEFVVYDIENLNNYQIKKIPSIDELDISGINKSLEYLKNNPISNKEIDSDYTVVINKIHECSNFIINELNNI